MARDDVTALWTADEARMRRLASELSGLPEARITHAATFHALGIDSVTAIRFARGGGSARPRPTSSASCPSASFHVICAAEQTESRHSQQRHHQRPWQQQHQPQQQKGQ